MCYWSGLSDKRIAMRINYHPILKMGLILDAVASGALNIEKD